METQQQPFIRRIVAPLALLYIAIVAVFSLLKAATPIFGAVPWAELIYGPAITIGSYFMLLIVALWIERLFRGRA
jgi:hypothetical protein